MEHWYTFQITLHRIDTATNECEKHEFRDCAPDRIAELSRAVWTTGIKINLTKGSWEIVSPFTIKTALILKQDAKYNLL